jgi:polar amino acid transport system permease protein
MSDTTDLSTAQLGDVAVPELYRSGRAKLQRAKRKRVLSYAIGIVILLFVVTQGDWGKIGHAYFDLDEWRAAFPAVIKVGMRNTVVITLLAFVGGVSIGLLMAFLKLSTIRPYRWFATTYIEIFRGLPALLTIIIIGFGVPTAFGWQFPVIFGVDSAGAIALSLVAGAYLAETIRAGINGVPKGQIEAARSLGMTQAQTTRVIIIPQALRLVIPPLTNELVLLLKDTSLLVVLGTTTTSVELTQFGRNAFNQNFNGSTLILVGLLYLVITIPMTQLVAYLERRNLARR